MSKVPFDLKHVCSLIIAVLLPFLPVGLAAVPLRAILVTVGKLLLLVTRPFCWRNKVQASSNLNGVNKYPKSGVARREDL
jgi:hypothetical protein